MSVITEQSPMTIGKILDKAINFIFKNIGWIVVIGFVISLPEFLSSELTVDSKTWEEIMALGWKLKLINTIVTPLMAGTVAILLGKQFCGQKMFWYEGLKKSVKRWLPLILIQLLVGIATVIGGILLVIPMFIVMSATACAIPAMMLEDLGPMKAFDRTWNLTKENRLRIFGYILLVGLIGAVCAGIPMAASTYIPLSPVYKAAIMALIHAPVNALWPAVTTVLFFDLRIRKEAMDLEEEARTISVEAEEVK